MYRFPKTKKPESKVIISDEAPAKAQNDFSVGWLCTKLNWLKTMVWRWWIKNLRKLYTVIMCRVSFLRIFTPYWTNKSNIWQWISQEIANLLSYNMRISVFDIIVPIFIPVIMSLVGKGAKCLIMEEHPMTLWNCYLDTPKILADWSVENYEYSYR